MKNTILGIVVLLGIAAGFFFAGCGTNHPPISQDTQKQELSVAQQYIKDNYGYLPDVPVNFYSGSIADICQNDFAGGCTDEVKIYIEVAPYNWVTCARVAHEYMHWVSFQLHGTWDDHHQIWLTPEWDRKAGNYCVATFGMN